MEPNFIKGLVGLSDRHWVAVKVIDNNFYLFDSKSSKEAPEPIT
jgi:hypothetical protein